MSLVCPCFVGVGLVRRHGEVGSNVVVELDGLRGGGGERQMAGCKVG